MQYIDLMMEKAGYPSEPRPFFHDLCLKLAADRRYEPLAKKLLDHDYTDVEEALLNPLRAMAPEYGVHEFSLILAFYMDATELLREKYQKNNISDELFWFAMVDYRCKLNECKVEHDVWGTMSAAWHAPFFHLTRFAHGRLQYDYSIFDADVYSKGGYTIHKGDSCLRIHIPSAGPLTKDLRLDSYRRAYEFNRERYAEQFGDAVPITCSSWLLYPAHLEMLPATSNIVSFIGDFDMLSQQEYDKFSNAGRVYGPLGKLEPEKWPAETSLQKAYKERMMAGGKAGSGYGAIFWNEGGRVY